jgi:LuxR family maltose regulon positive regulatory protein
MRTHLADSRLSVPPLPPRHVARPRLVAALERATEVPLTLVSAGAGAGKTVLLSEWARQTDDRIVWLTLSSVDVKPTRFWGLLARALRQADALPFVDTMELAGLPADSLPVTVKAPGDQPCNAPARVTVVIDGAHLIREPRLLHALDGLIRGCGDALRLVLLARSDPLLPLHRYRLVGLMRELRGADLAMMQHEIEAVLTAHGVKLLPHEIDTVARTTEGWAAGVRLSAMRMEGKTRPGEFVSELAIDHGSVGEYLLEEVLADQPEAVRRMLVQTSFLDEVTGPLASAVTGIDRCGEMLDDLARTNSFVVPVDPGHTRFRYHQLFRDVLRYLLQRDAQPDFSALCRRASACFETSGDLTNALYWALRAGDRSHMARLLLHGAFIHAFVHRSDVSGWDLSELASLITRQVRDEPATTEHTVLTRVVWALLADGEQAAQLSASEGRTSVISADPVVLATSDLAELVLAQKAGQPWRVWAAAGALLSRELPIGKQLPPGFRSAVMLAAGTAHFWAGHQQECTDLLEQCVAGLPHSPANALHAEALGTLAFVESYWTRSHRAEAAAGRADELLAAERLEAPVALQLAAALRCLTAANLGGMDLVLKGTLFRDLVGLEPGLEAAVILVQASLLIACDQPVAAHAVLQTPRRYLAPPLLRTLLDVQMAAVEHMLGRPRAALQILEPYPTGYELAVSPGDTGMAYLVATARAQAQLALGESREAARGIRALLTSTSPHVGRYQIVDGLMCAALIAHTEDDQGRALEMLIRALQVADGDIRWPVVRLTDAFAGMLQRHPSIAAQWPVPLVPRQPVIEGWPRRVRPDAPPVVLTDRERAVLRFLATGMSTAEIAGELCVSINTVKTHLAAIYRKLPARKRREAVSRARELELL